MKKFLSAMLAAVMLISSISIVGYAQDSITLTPTTNSTISYTAFSYAKAGTKVMFNTPAVDTGYSVKYFNNGTEIPSADIATNVLADTVALPVLAGWNVYTAQLFDSSNQKVAESTETKIFGSTYAASGNDTARTAGYTEVTDTLKGYINNNSATAAQKTLAKKVLEYNEATGTYGRENVYNISATSSSAGTTTKSINDIIEVKYDLYVTGDTRAKSVYLNGHSIMSGGSYVSGSFSSTYLLKSDNSLQLRGVDTGYDLTANSWHTVRLYYDIANDGIDCYVDDVLIAKNLQAGFKTGYSALDGCSLKSWGSYIASSDDGSTRNNVYVSNASINNTYIHSACPEISISEVEGQENKIMVTAENIGNNSLALFVNEQRTEDVVKTDGSATPITLDTDALGASVYVAAVDGAGNIVRGTLGLMKSNALRMDVSATFDGIISNFTNKSLDAYVKINKSFIPSLYQDRINVFAVNSKNEILMKKCVFDSDIGQVSFSAQEFNTKTASIDKMFIWDIQNMKAFSNVLVSPITAEFDPNDIVFSFGAISDIHIDDKETDGVKVASEKFESALEQLCAKAAEDDADGIDAVAIAGDIAHNGTAAQVEEFARIVKASDVGTNVLLTTGNHDVLGDDANMSDYYTALGEDYFAADVDNSDFEASGSRHCVVNGYDLIFVEPRKYGDGCPYRDATLEWLDSKLATLTAANPDKYIFLFTHPVISDTVYGSGEIGHKDEDGVWATTYLDDILKKYPQVMTFGGHIHFPIIDERSIMQRDYTSLGCGSVRYLCVENGYENANNTVPTGAYDLSVGHLVQVDGDGNVRITRMDFAHGGTSKEPWIVAHPDEEKTHLSKYTLARANVNEAPVLTGEISFADGKVSIAAGTDDDFVHHYVITVTDKTTSTEVGTYKYLSDFYSTMNPSDMSKTFTKNINLTAEGEYTIQIKAVDSWDAESNVLTKDVVISLAE